MIWLGAVKVLIKYRNTISGFHSIDTVNIIILENAILCNKYFLYGLNTNLQPTFRYSGIIHCIQRCSQSLAHNNGTVNGKLEVTEG